MLTAKKECQCMCRQEHQSRTSGSARRGSTSALRRQPLVVALDRGDGPGQDAFGQGAVVGLASHDGIFLLREEGAAKELLGLPPAHIRLRVTIECIDTNECA